jgi:tRNA modification GTPase
MYDLKDTVVAAGSPSGGVRSIIRMTGPQTVRVCSRVFRPPTALDKRGIVCGQVLVDDELAVDAKLYLFFAPHSYTGEMLAELHIDAPQVIIETIVQKLLAFGLRTAGPGEFTARAYLNGKIDLAQAEAVNEIIVSSNKFQLAAAEQLLAGRLAEAAAKLRTDIMDCLSLIEAELDFSGENINQVGPGQTSERLTGIIQQFEQLLSSSLHCESIIDLPAVGIAGAPSAGKSTLLNALLGTKRSIVSQQHKTTRDVLTGLLTLKHCRCVLFDCAGLVTEPENMLDELAQQAAFEALRSSAIAVFCVDLSKPDWSEDAVIRGLIDPQVLIPVATKADLLCEDVLARSVENLNEQFGQEFLPISAKTGQGLDLLRKTIDAKLLEHADLPQGLSVCGELGRTENARDTIALTARHRHAVTEALASVRQAQAELKAGNEEVAAMLMRSAYQEICDIERQPIDEQLLDRIFSRFCIGK